MENLTGSAPLDPDQIEQVMTEPSELESFIHGRRELGNRRPALLLTVELRMGKPYE